MNLDKLREHVRYGDVENITAFGVDGHWEVWAEGRRIEDKRLKTARGEVRRIRTLDGAHAIIRAAGWKFGFAVDSYAGDGDSGT